MKLGTYWTCYTWLPSFLLHEMNQGIGKSVSWVLTAQLGQLGGMLSFGWFSDRFGRRPAYSIYSALTAMALATLAFGWQWLSGLPFAFWLTMLLLGVGSAAPPASARSWRAVPDRDPRRGDGRDLQTWRARRNCSRRWWSARRSGPTDSPAV